MKSDSRVACDRIVIRSYRSTDYQSWAEGFLGRLSKKSVFDPGPVPAVSVSASTFQKKFKGYRQAAKEDRCYVFGVFDKKGRHLGAVDISMIRRGNAQWANLGYWIHNQYWGQGYAKEAAQAALKIAFEKLGFHRIEATVDPKNKPSIAVAKAIGLKKECCRRKFEFENGRWVDVLVFSATAGD